MNREGGFSRETSNESELQEIQKKIDNVIQQIIEHWNKDKGWSLTLFSEKEKQQLGFIKEQNEKADALQAIEQEMIVKKNALAELSLKFLKFGKGKLEKEVSEHEDQADSVKSELVELSEKQQDARQAFEHQKAVLEQLLKDYYLKMEMRDPREFEKVFPYAKIYKPSYHDLRTNKTSPEDMKKEEEDQVAYITDFTKMFEQYGADIIKREKQ